ncbi:MAG TPA: class I SAM-dependent DNA methyltransferase, partial [Candidatus Competibacteraceae bacterium]|nr:class I SAM-dependent DNA methyltransferase [Candidatus Competibacteraceae bacterium]
EIIPKQSTTWNSKRKSCEHQVMLEAETLGLQRGFPTVGPEAVIGIEINPYAAELARLTVWIGEIQWMLGHGYSLNDQPILKPLNSIECRDALLDIPPEFPPCQGGVSQRDGGVLPNVSNHPGAARHPSLSKEGNSVSEAAWPVAEVIVGNPPFLGGGKLLRELGDEYVGTLRQTYAGRVPGGADLVCYWFEKARAQIEAGQAQRAGLVATNSIRGGANRKVLERIRETGAIFNAWSDLEWVNEGAAVRVSLVGFGGGEAGGILNGQPVAQIYADLTSPASDHDRSSDDLTQAQPLRENADRCFRGTTKNGPFDIPGDLARQWLMQPNSHGRPNSDVLHPWANGMDVTRRPSDTWIIDFGVNMPEAEAMLYEKPFEYVIQHVKPNRDRSRDLNCRKYWWRYERPRPELRAFIKLLTRYMATVMVAKHRFFIWMDCDVLPDQRLITITRDDDTTFGILHSRLHELWSLGVCSWHGVGNDPVYNGTLCFDTFPFPTGLTPNLPASAYADDPHAQAIAVAARKLNELRENWLNPPQWVNRVPEVVPGYPDRIIPKPEHAAELKKRTLTNLYNQRPAWLDYAHRALDEAVAAAYGWPADLSDDEVLRRLLTLNRERTR